MMAPCFALPRVDHMEQMLQIFAHLGEHHNRELVFDPSNLVIDELKYEKQDWAPSESDL